MTLPFVLYSKTCVKRSLKEYTKERRMVAKFMSKVLQNAFCNAFGLHKAITSLETQFLVFLRVAVLHRVYCSIRLKFSCVDIVLAEVFFNYKRILIFSSAVMIDLKHFKFAAIYIKLYPINT